MGGGGLTRDRAGPIRGVNMEKATTPPPATVSFGPMTCLRCAKRTDADVVAVTQRKLHRSGAGIHMRPLFQPIDKRPPPRQGNVKIIDPEEQQKTIARRGTVRTGQRRMPVGTLRMKAKQNRSIRVRDLPKVIVRGNRFRQPMQRLVPLEPTLPGNGKPPSPAVTLRGKPIAISILHGQFASPVGTKPQEYTGFFCKKTNQPAGRQIHLSKFLS